MTASTYTEYVAATAATAPAITPAIRDRIIAVLSLTGGAGR
jgi:hypothetical protein